MEDLTGLGKIIESKVVTETYEEVSPAIREAGQFLQDAAKTFRLFLFPIQILSIAQDRLARFCEKARSKVPPERQVEAPSYIATPALLDLRCIEDDNPISDLYVNLLAKAVDRDEQPRIHPAFVKIVGQLSPIEALYLHELNNNPIELKVYVDDSGHATEVLEASFRSDDGSLDSLTILDHLHSLNLIKYTPRDPELVSDKPNLTLMRVDYSLSRFGKQFVDVCEP